MLKAKEQIIEDIRTHIQRRGGSYNDWYVGIGLKAKECLFKDHGVKPKGDRWILRRAESPQAAREVLDYFVSILATDYGVPRGDGMEDAVYAYRKSGHTRP